MAIDDEARAICDAFVAAWNAHDMAAFGALFHANATFVNRFGAYWRGRDRIVAEHAAIHRTVYSDMRLETVRVDVDALGDSIAVVHCLTRAHMGEAMPVGPRRLETDMLVVVERRDGVAAIRAGENVAVLDARSQQPILTTGDATSVS